MISDLTNLPVPVLAVPVLAEPPIADLPNKPRLSGEARGSIVISRTNGHSRGGQNHLPANRRAKLRELRSRVRILQKAFVRTRSIACADLYGKAIKVARSDIADLEAV